MKILKTLTYATLLQTVNCVGREAPVMSYAVLCSYMQGQQTGAQWWDSNYMSGSVVEREQHGEHSTQQFWKELVVQSYRPFGILCCEEPIREGFNKNKKWIDLSIRAGWLGSARGQNPTTKKIQR